MGGIDSWGSLPLAEHRLDPTQPYSWAFTLRPFAPSDRLIGPNRNPNPNPNPNPGLALDVP